MFTGIIESTGTVDKIEDRGSNRTFWIHSPLGPGLKVDQSLAHDGVCLTVEALQGNTHQVTAIRETLLKSGLGSWKPGTSVNLERSLRPDGRLDGHFVQGHVDGQGRLLEKKDCQGSWEFTFSFAPAFAPLLIEKGSIALNGISLTIFNVGTDRFTVAIIPYTYTHTNLAALQPGDNVNLEFDMVGKYILRNQRLAAGI